jgi:CheY-like chemotaxis protein
MTNFDKNDEKLKKDIKWYTYVDKELDQKFQKFIKKRNIKSRASLIRDSVKLYMNCDKLIQKSLGITENLPRQHIFSVVEECLRNRKKYAGVYEELKQYLSPLKIAILLTTKINDLPENVSRKLAQIEKAVEKLENILKERFENPSPIIVKDKVDILHVEDNELDREIIKDYFQQKGFRVQSAMTSEQALDFLKHSVPRLILLDLGLKTSKMQGEELCRQIKSQEEYAEIPVIIMTALVSKVKKRQILTKTNATDLIVKPIAELSELDKITDYI